MTKLTLSVDEETVKRAKRLAEQQGTSVSAMFRQFVKAMDREAASPAQAGPLARRALGLIRWPKGASERDIVADALLEKYGLSK